jgi:hypothetical protein
MAIALLMTFATDGRDVLDLYDKANAKMHTVGEAPAGLIFHWAAKTERGDLRIVDVWESREHFDRFFGERLGPASAELQLPKPNVEELNVHNIIQGGVPSRT